MDKQQSFCPFCGVPLILPIQYAHPIPECPNCHYLALNAPRPVVLTLVYAGDRLLLGRSPRFTPGNYALLAGHVEMGETAEQAAVREVREESGVDCVITHYLGSFALPARNQLCLTFAARYLQGEAIAADDVEDVRWFEQTTDLPVQGSIAREVIARWRLGQGAAVRTEG